MDFSITSSPKGAIEKVAAALVELAKGVEPEAKAENPASAANATAATAHADAVSALVHGGFVERILGETRTGVAAAPAQPPGERVDKGVETANLQTFARPHAPVSEPLRPADTALPTDRNANSEFAVPASLLIPATLTSLQVERAASWPMTARGFDPDPKPLHEARIHDRHPAPPPVAEELEEHEDEPAQEPDPAAEDDADPACSVLSENEDGDGWCEELTRAVRLALAAPLPPRALVLADEQWRRGRCVVLACPQGADPTGPAWAFVLWPRRRPDERWRRAASLPPQPLALFGLRVEASLRWFDPERAAHWRYARMIKEHHPRSGRQLVVAEAAVKAGVPAVAPCAMQLGPVLAHRPRPCDVCVRIAAAQRFWAALGRQWSVHVIVSPRRLVGAPAQTAEDPSC